MQPFENDSLKLLRLLHFSSTVEPVAALLKKEQSAGHGLSGLCKVMYITRILIDF